MSPRRLLLALSLLPACSDDVAQSTTGASSSGDASPVAGLKALEELAIGANQIADISPLANHPLLTSLLMPETLVTDVSPLVGLPVLEALYLADNGITDVTPIAEFTTLFRLDRAAQIAAATSPAQLHLVARQRRPQAAPRGIRSS